MATALGVAFLMVWLHAEGFEYRSFLCGFLPWSLNIYSALSLASGEVWRYRGKKKDVWLQGNEHVGEKHRGGLVFPSHV
ncbi:hypothetical protein BCR34DRAFT_578385 [Clohesyomyces aquaticus]|uniref:Uncharacterized protein n=1 Tax=Clohesyomyces aquaticus TaxID=1231657 RepID=A0A1Y1YFN9_9PLEO|nr:hypothetical protein BCR34DRAFT_578385 [Clohesyomyces aquaticus]